MTDNAIIDKLRECPSGGCLLSQAEASAVFAVLEQSQRLIAASRKLIETVERQDAVSSTGQETAPSLVDEAGYIWRAEDAGKLTNKGNVISADIRSGFGLVRSGSVWIWAEHTEQALSFGWQTDGPPVEQARGLLQKVTR